MAFSPEKPQKACEVAFVRLRMVAPDEFAEIGNGILFSRIARMMGPLL